MQSNYQNYKKVLLNALEEDIGTGDITSLSSVSENQILTAKLIAKEGGVLSGIGIAEFVLSLLDEKVRFNHLIADGEAFKKGDIIAKIESNGRALLSGERVMLNLLQRMCGIATLTDKFVREVEGTKAKILDTRKTAPGLRIFDKLAVKHGGGENHRFGLFDMALIKENHITAAGGISAAVQKVRSNIGDKFLVEVEVKNLDELREALTLKIDRILLDNMSVPGMTEAVRITNGRIPLEASGNVNLDTIRKIAKSGVDYISIGMLTHSVRALDLSLIIT